MNIKQKADELITHFKMILMNEDTDCGCEILCTSIAKKCALITVNNIINANPHSNPFNTDIYSTMDYWINVKKIIEKL
jgi:hypothetical protein